MALHADKWLYKNNNNIMSAESITACFLITYSIIMGGFRGLGFTKWVSRSAKCSATYVLIYVEALIYIAKRF